MSWPIFISYRRGPDAATALRLWRVLTHAFGEDAAFLDAKSIRGGDVFRTTIDFAVSACDAMLVLIGERWAPARLRAGPPFSDDVDFVQHEVASGLRRGVLMMPILVEGALLPEGKELPNDIQSLLQHQTQKLRRSMFEEDLKSILSRLNELPELSGQRARSSSDSRYVAQMSKVLFPERPIKALTREVVDRVGSGDLPVALRGGQVPEGETTKGSDPEVALQVLNEIAKAKGSEAELLDAQLDVADAYFSLGAYPSVSAALSLANDAINKAIRRASEDSRLEGLEVEVVVKADSGIEPWMIDARQRVAAAPLLFHDSGLCDSIARFHTIAGRYFSALGNIEAARQYFYEASLHYEQTSDIEGLVISQLNLGRCAYGSARLDDAEGLCRKALVWAEALDAPPYVALASTSLGVVYRRRGRYDLAQQMLTDAFDLAKRLGSRGQMAGTGRELALAYFAAGELDLAEKWHRRVLHIERARKSIDGVARQLHNLASVHAQRGEYVAAEGMYRQALETNRSIGRTEGIALQLTNLGAVLRELDRPEEARELLREALELNEELRQPVRIAETCVNLGSLEAAMGRSEAAVGFLRRAVDLSSEGPGRLTAWALTALAEVHEQRSEPELAESSYLEALPLLARLGQESQRGAVLVQLGLLANALGCHEKVLPRLREALEIFECQEMPEARGLANTIREIVEAGQE